MISKFKNQLMVLIALLLLLPVLIIGAMLYMVNHTMPVVLDEQRETLTMAVEELSQKVPPNISQLIKKQESLKKNRIEQIKSLNRELAGAVMKAFQSPCCATPPKAGCPMTSYTGAKVPTPKHIIRDTKN